MWLKWHELRQTVASTAQALPKLFGNLSLGGTKLDSIEIFRGESVIPVDGSEIRRSPVDVGSLSHYLQVFTIHLRWLGMGFLNHQQYEFSTRGSCDCFGAKSVEYLSINDDAFPT